MNRNWISAFWISDVISPIVKKSSLVKAKPLILHSQIQEGVILIPLFLLKVAKKRGDVFV